MQPITTSPFHHLTIMQFLGMLANRIYYHAWYSVIYQALIGLSCVVIAWTLASFGQSPSSFLFITCDVLMTILLVVDIVVRMLVHGKGFWSDYWNWADLVISSLCVISVAMYIHRYQVIEDLEEISASIALIARNLLQYLRLMIVLRNRYQKSYITNHGHTNIQIDTYSPLQGVEEAALDQFLDDAACEESSQLLASPTVQSSEDATSAIGVPGDKSSLNVSEQRLALNHAYFTKPGGISEANVEICPADVGEEVETILL